MRISDKEVSIQDVETTVRVLELIGEEVFELGLHTNKPEHVVAAIMGVRSIGEVITIVLHGLDEAVKDGTISRDDLTDRLVSMSERIGI